MSEDVNKGRIAQFVIPFNAVENGKGGRLEGELSGIAQI